MPIAASIAQGQSSAKLCLAHELHEFLFGHLGLLVGHIALVSKDRICNTLQIGIGNLAARTVHRSRRGAYAQRLLGIKRNGLGDIEHLAAANTHYHVAILGLGFLSHFDNGLFRTRTVINLKERLA